MSTSVPEAQPPFLAEAARGATNAGLRALLGDHWEALLRRSPTWATRLGDHRWDGELGDASPEGWRRARSERDRFIARARALERLDAADRLHRDLLLALLEEEAATDVAHSEWWSLSARENPLATVNDLAEIQPLTTLTAAAALLARYRQIPRHVEEVKANLRLGIAAGYTPEAASAGLVLTQLRDELARSDADLTLAAPLAEPHPDWPLAALDAWRADLAAAIAGARGALAGFAAFVEAELLPACRPADRAGIGWLPRGEEAYAALILRETSLHLGAAEIHAIGLEELAATHAELRALGSRLFDLTDLDAIFARLRTDPALRFSTRDEVEAAAVDNLARAKAAMPAWFGRLPVADCVVRPVPDYLAPYTYVAYYNPAPADGASPGEYRINLHAPTTRPRFEAAALAWHESIPGHHLQISLAQELSDIPAFRRHLGWNATVEGWALYAERLAEEMGLYATDLDRLGMLSFDTWRSARLVVDTGIHAFGWTRDRAVAFMLANTPLAENNIRNEVDRYITWPAQALAYKLGQRAILGFRRDAEAALGSRFDVRAFHDALLAVGAVSLPVLEAQVRTWAESEARAARSA